MLFIDNLYDNIFKKYAVDYEEINIITGYASGTFLTSVMDDFKNLKINLYIGMYNEGISKRSHSIYKEITNNTPSNVFYQIKNKPTHMKVYQLKNKSNSLCFLGSANFSENGFHHNNEILALVGNVQDSLFYNQLQNSIICTAENIEDYINIIDDVVVFTESEIDEITIANDSKGIYGVGDGGLKNNISLLINRLYTRKNLLFYNKFSISVVLSEESDVSWYYRGINDNFPYIKQNNQIRFAEVFPENLTFKIYAPDYIFDCRLGGKYNSNLYFLNINIYEYFARKLNIVEKTPINAYELDKLGVNKLYFERVNELEYTLKFEE